MDQNLLVINGQALVRALDADGLVARLVMWVHASDTDTWKLWMVAPVGMQDKREFYRRLAEVVSRHRAEVGGIDAGDVEMIPDTHPAVQGLRRFVKAPGLATIQFSGNTFDGYYLPDGIILRSAL